MFFVWVGGGAVGGGHVIFEERNNIELVDISAYTLSCFYGKFCISFY